MAKIEIEKLNPALKPQHFNFPFLCIGIFVLVKILTKMFSTKLEESLPKHFVLHFHKNVL